MAQASPWTVKLDVLQDIEIRPVPEGRRDLRAGQPMLSPIGRAVDAAVEVQ